MNETMKDHYRAILQEIDAQIAALSPLIEEKKRIEQLLGESTGEGISLDGLQIPKTGAPVQKHVESDSFFGMTIIDAAKKYIRMTGKKQGIPAITTALLAGGIKGEQADLAQAISSGLAREAKKIGDVVKVSRGEYGLYEFYPGLKQKHLNEAKKNQTNGEKDGDDEKPEGEESESKESEEGRAVQEP
jgi:hypothetical protein